MTQPAPYPPDTKAKGWRYEIDVDRLEQSDTWALASPDVRPWLLMLWVVSWKQCPCGSLPADDALIVARLGIAPKVFSKVRQVLMRGWYEADDGRLYHKTITVLVLEMLAKKKTEADRKREWRQRKEAEAKLAELGVSKVTKIDDYDQRHGQSVRDLSHGTDLVQTSQSIVVDDTGTRTGTGTGLEKARASSRACGPVGPARAFFENREAGSGSGWGALPGQVSVVAEAAAMAMRGAGLADVSPADAKLVGLLNAGMTVQELVDAAAYAVSLGRGTAYALARAEGRRRDAAAAASLPAAPVGGALDPDSRGGIEASAAALGLPAWDQTREQWPQFAARVRKARSDAAAGVAA